MVIAGSASSLLSMVVIKMQELDGAARDPLSALIMLFYREAP
jgi:hypothetical protein